MAAAPLFICHAFTENDFARDLGLALETCRLPVWRDNRHLRGSERLAPDVRWAIEQARQVIVVIGLNTADPSWLRREIEIAQETERRRADGYRVIPLLLPGVDPALLNRWLTPLPPTAPIGLTAEGLGAALPALLAALDAPPLFDADRNPSSLEELTLTFGPADAESRGRWPLAVRLSRSSTPAPPVSAQARVGPPPSPVPERILRWYWQDYPCWPIDATRQFARRVDAVLTQCGHALYQATLADPELQTLIADWLNSSERRLTLQAEAPEPRALDWLALPWELLHDSAGFLIQGKQPLEFQRRLPGGGDPAFPAPVPLRLLVVNPRPDTEPTGHPDHRRSAAPLFEALHSLGLLVEARVLAPPTHIALEKELNEAWAAGRSFVALHLDGYLRSAAAEAPLFAFEAAPDSLGAKYRDAEFMPVPILASLLATYRMRLVVLTGAGPAAVAMVATLLAAGIAAVITVHPNAPADALRRFWGAFYEELLRGARIGQAVFAGQRRLSSDTYRAQGLGGGGVHLHDWFAIQLYLGHQEPRLALRPPLDLWRRLLNPQSPGSTSRLPEPPAAGFVGRGRNLLILERLLVHHAAIFIRGPGGCGKTATATALAAWLTRCDHYPHTAYLGAEDANDPRTLVESLGQQLLPNGRHWTVASYPNLWQAVDHLSQTRRARPTLIILDQLEQWPAEHDELFERFWKKLLDEGPELRLLGLGRLGPPAFAAPWREIVLGPLDDRDAIALMSRTLTATGEIPPAADSGDGFEPLRELVTLAGGHPGAVRRLAHEISDRGVSAALQHLRAVRSALLRRQSDDLQWPLYLEVELALKRLSASDRDRLAILAFAKGGINRLTLGHALELDNPITHALCEKLIALNLAEDEGYGHLRIDPALANYLNSQMSADQRTEWRSRWRAAMERLLTFLYQQYFKDTVRTLRLLRLELPNLLALLRDCHQQQSPPERTARLASQMESLFTHLGVPAALAETVATRERAGQALPGWSRTRFETERLRIERLRDSASLEEAVQAARHLARQCQEAGAHAYAGATYDQARAHFELGKLLKMASAAEPAVRELTTARQQFQALVEAGNSSAARMAAVADAEIGDCLTHLRRLQDAATAYEAALAQADPNSATAAANQLQLGLVYQQQSKYAAAVTLYDAARRTFETLGQPGKAAQAWRQLSMAQKLGGQMEQALQAGQKALYLCEQQRNRRGVAEILGEVGHLHQVLNQLEEAALAYRRMAELYAQLGDGRGEEAGRNKLANVLIQLRRPDEARQELYRASECNPPESPTTRNWTIRRGLRDVSQGVKNVEIADQARRQAIHKYLAYRRSGGENANPGIRLCAQVSEALRNGDPEMIRALAAKLGQIAASPNVPPTGKLLIDKLRAILNGDRDASLFSDAELHYQYAAELQLLLEELPSSNQ